MSIQGTIKRYGLIINKITHGELPSFSDMHEMLHNEGFQISSRTLQRDFEDIRDEFGIEITYDNQKNGYFINYEKSVNADHILHFLELAASADVMIDSLKKGKDVLKYISFDSYGHFRGINNIERLLRAIKNNRKITFSHTSYQTEETKIFELAPYLLKEFQGRWYIYGEDLADKKFKIYGLDRINELQISEQKFTPKTDIDVLERFNNMIGISSSWSGEGIEEVILSFSKEQWNYFEALPWLTDYKIVADSKNVRQVSLSIIPNTELIQTILKHSEGVTVIAPEWLRKEIKKILKKSLKSY